MSDRQKQAPSPRQPQPHGDSAGGLSPARRLLDRIGQLAQQARDTAENLAGRLMPKGAVRATSTVVTAPEAEKKPEAKPGRESKPAPEPSSAVAPVAPVDGRDAGGDLHPVADGETRVVLLSRDPEWLFCYWNVAAKARAAARIDQSRLTLRLHDVTELEFDGANGWSQHLYPLTEEARWWHVPVPHRGRHYLAEVGYCTVDGTFRPLGRSEAVATLDQELASSTEPESATIHIDAPRTDQDSHPSAEGSEPDVAEPGGDRRDPAAGSPVHFPATGPDDSPPARGDRPGALQARSRAGITSPSGGAESAPRPTSSTSSHTRSSVPWSRQG